MDELPPELQAFAFLLDAQPAPVQDIFQYCLCLMMVEMDRMWLVGTTPGDAGSICTFQTVAGDTFRINRPSMSQEEESAMLEVLRDILRDEDLI